MSLHLCNAKEFLPQSWLCHFLSLTAWKKGQLGINNPPLHSPSLHCWTKLFTSFAKAILSLNFQGFLQRSLLTTLKRVFYHAESFFLRQGCCFLRKPRGLPCLIPPSHQPLQADSLCLSSLHFPSAWGCLQQRTTEPSWGLSVSLLLWVLLVGMQPFPRAVVGSLPKVPSHGSPSDLYSRPGLKCQLRSHFRAFQLLPLPVSRLTSPS